MPGDREQWAELLRALKWSTLTMQLAQTTYLLTTTSQKATLIASKPSLCPQSCCNFDQQVGGTATWRRLRCASASD